MPNVIWGLELTPGAIATYGYLLFRENRKTYKCYPSFEDIGRAIGRSKRSVPEYVAELVDKKLIEVKNTTLTSTSALAVTDCSAMRKAWI